MTDAMVKATPVNGLAEFVSRELSPTQQQTLLAQLSTDEAKWFDGKLLASAQVPLKSVNRYTALAAAARGEPVEAFGLRAGRYGAQLGLKSVYKFIMMLMSPDSVLRAAPLMWKKVYDRGVMNVETLPGGARIRISEFPNEKAGCARITGWFEVIAEKSARDAKVKHSTCTATGGSECVWEFDWNL